MQKKHSFSNLTKSPSNDTLTLQLNSLFKALPISEPSNNDSNSSGAEGRMGEVTCEAKQSSHESNGLANSHSFKSLKSGSQSRHYQQQPSVRFNSRILDRRIQRRHMTDPLSAAAAATQVNGIDEKHSVIMNSLIKRNSLNEKPKVKCSQIKDSYYVFIL